MQLTRKIDSDIIYLGVNDRRLSLFENVYPVPEGASYNSYLILDNKTCLLDTSDKSGEAQFIENLEYALNGRKLDYIVVHHMEPDHSASLKSVLHCHPEATVVLSDKAVVMAENFMKITFKKITVKEGNELPLGKHTLHFVSAPMVHWPEVMVSYDDYTKTLFSADAFGSFGALGGSLYADSIDFKGHYTDEMRRYYTNIVGKYGDQVQSLLKKASSLDIQRICPLHGYIWRKDINYAIGKYCEWSSYKPEIKGVLIVYASVYRNTEDVAETFANMLAEKGVHHVAIYDVSKTDDSYLIAESFRYSHIAIATTTYNAGIFVNMENFINDFVAHGIRNRKFAIIENGTWAPTAGNLVKEKLSKLKGAEFVDDTIKITSSSDDSVISRLDAISSIWANEINAELTPCPSCEVASSIDKTAFFKLSYGLFVISTKGERDNGCIVNTVTQLTDNPKVITLAVNKANYTNELILKTGKFNVSILGESAPFDLFKRFGFASGRDTDKFDGFDSVARSSNGLTYLTAYTCAYMSAEVIKSYDYGTHTLFVAEVKEAQTISQESPMTYKYYFDNVKNKPTVTDDPKKGWVCKICGYVHEGEELPPDIVCPLCKHGADDFEKIK